MSSDHPFDVIDGGQATAPPGDALAVVVTEYEGLRVVRKPGCPPLYEIDRARFEPRPDAELEAEGALVRLQLHQHPDKYEPGEAAAVIMEAMRAQGMLSHHRQRMLEGIPQHSHQMTRHAPSYMRLLGWLERWWCSLKMH